MKNTPRNKGTEVPELVKIQSTIVRDGLLHTCSTVYLVLREIGHSHVSDMLSWQKDL